MGYKEDLERQMDRLQGRTTTATPTATPQTTTSVADNSSYFDKLNAQMDRLLGVQSVPQPAQSTISQPTYANHGAIAQQGHQNIAQKQAGIAANVTKPMTTYLQNGGSININDTASLAQLARERGMSEDNIRYLQGRQQASTLPSMQTQYKPLPGSTTPVAIPNSGYDPVKSYDIGYGNKEAQETLNNLKMNNDDRSASTYVDAKANLEKAQQKGNLREIAKNQAIVDNYKDAYKSNYNKEWDNLKDSDIKSLREHVTGALEDLNKSAEKVRTSTGENLQTALAEYKRDYERYEEVKRRYDEAITYDEIVNGKPIRDFAKNVGVGATGSVAKGMTYGKLAEDATLDFFGSARNPANINAKSLLNYNNENYERDKYSGVIEREAGDIDTTGEYQNMSPQEAFSRLKQLATNNPEYRGLRTLLDQISTHTYKGTEQELANELDRISREMYQGWKNTHTQAGFDWEEAQREHTERAYADNDFAKTMMNAGMTVGEMLPSVAAGFVGQPASMATLFASAAGGAADQAINQGATINQGTLYGALSGATEVGTELIGGENVNRFLGMKGQSLLSKVFGNSIKNLHIDSKAAKVALNTLFDVGGEMLEEATSEAINPLLQTITYDPTAMPDNVDEYFQNIFEAAIEAIPSTLLMEGMGGATNVIRINQVENGIINRINESDLSPIIKNQLTNEVRKASRDVKLGLEESDYIEKRTNERYSTLQAQSEQMKQRIPQGYILPQSTVDILAYTENNRPGLTIAFDNTIKGNGNFIDNGDGTRTITLNPNSKRAVEFVLTHELGHDLKGTAEYTQLQNLLMDYAKGKPNYQKSLNALEKTYRESGANYNLQDEATNDMLGEAIGEQEFYNKLAENPTLFNRVTNGLKSLLGNKDTKLKNKIEKLTSNALKQEYRGKQGGTQQSLSEIQLPNDIDYTDGGNHVNEALIQMFPEWELTKDNASRYVDFFQNKHRSDYDDLPRNSSTKVLTTMIDDNLVKLTTTVENGKLWIDELYVEKQNQGTGTKVVNALKEYAKRAGLELDTNKEMSTAKGFWDKALGRDNTQYSLSEAPTQDNQGRQLSEGQQTYFRDSKVKDVDGKLLTMYHGTNGDFYTFDLGKIGNNTKNAGNFGDGFYFTYSKDRAKDYGKNVKETYLNIQNPFSYDSLYYLPNGTESYSDYTVITNLVNMNNEWGKIPIKFGSKYTWQDIADTVNKMSNEGATDSQIDSALYEKYGDIAEQGLPDRIYTYAKQEGYKTLREALAEQGYDGIIDGKTAQDSSQIVAFNSNQIKNIDNQNPTDNEDIRYSKQNNTWQQFLDDTYGKWNTGTRTNFTKADTTMLPSNEELQGQESKGINAILKDLKIPTNEELQKTERESVKKEPIVQANKITSTKRLDDVRDFKKVGDRKVNAYQYDNPEVKPFFQHEAKNMLQDLNNAIKGERVWSQNGEGYGAESYYNVSGITREVTDDIADLLDGNNGVKLSYDDIRKGLNAIIEDHGAENIAAAKRIEMVLDKRLREGYTDSYGTEYPANENYQNFLEGKEYTDPAEYERQQAQKMMNDDGMLFSLSEEQQKEVNDYADKLFEDKTLDENFATDVYDRLKRVQNYPDFENIKQEVSDYKDKMYKGISSLADIANLKPEDVKQQPMTYKQQKNKNTANQRRFFENVETSNIVAEETKNRVNSTNYEVKHNLDTMEKMRQKLDTEGNKLVEDWKTKSVKRFTDEDVALGSILLERYQQNKDFESAARTAEKLADVATESARALQMFSIWQRLSPETMQLFAQKQLNEAFEEMKQRKTGKWVEANKDKFKLTAEDTQFIYEQVEKASQAIDEETKQRELSKIENRINEKLPPEAGQSIKALRRIAMLFNPKTQVRNIVGNTLIMPVNDVADFIGSLIDKLVSRWSKIRTTSSPNLITKAKGFKKGIRDAITDYKTGTRTTATGSKYEFDIGAKPFNENTGSKVRNAINRKLNGINDLLSAVMSGGDRPFYEAAYKNSLEGQMKANDVSEPTPEMVDIAVNEALQRTWNDDNEYTNFVLGLRRGMNKINVHGFGFGDLIIPFAKTPANLTKAIVEYSPAGFIKSVIDFNDMRKAISRGELTPMQQKKFVSSMSKAIAGTILYTIAGTLARTGAITGSADDDKDVKNFEQNVLGIQPYSVRLGDKTFTYSWANPINAPLAIMADQYKMEKENAKLADRLYDYFKVAGNVLLENSFLQGVQELFGNQDGIMGGIIESIESMPEQLIPTFMSQIASLGDDTQRQTFEYKDEAKTVANRLKNKIPGARNTLEAQVNTFGEEIENQNNVFNAFLNPANVREAKTTEAQNELYSLYEATKDKTIFPVQVPYYVTDNGEKKNLTPKQRNTYQKASGKYATSIYDDLFDSDYYDSISDSKKTAILQKVAQDANKIGKTQVGVWNNESIKLDYRKQDLEDMSIPLADYYIAWSAQKDVEGDKNANGKTINLSSSKNKKEAIDKAVKGLEQEQMEMLYGIFDISEKVW